MFNVKKYLLQGFSEKECVSFNINKVLKYIKNCHVQINTLKGIKCEHSDKKIISSYERYICKSKIQREATSIRVKNKINYPII